MRRYAHTALPMTLVALVAVGASTLGVAAAQPQQKPAGPAYGGTLRVAYAGNMSSFDAAQALSDDWFLIQGTLYNGLYGYDRNGHPQLDLAAAPPAVSRDGTVWTFHLRRGVRFSNGLPMTAADVAFSITRILDPHLKPAVSWGQPTDEVFQGWQAFVAGKAKSVSGIQVLNPSTIRFVLTHKVAILPDILAESFNMVVPKAVVSKESADSFASHPVGTGPFLLQAYKPGVEATFVRNPYYFHAGKPYLAKIIASINVAPSLIALRVEKGELQGFGRGTELSAADLQQARSDPTYAAYLVTGAPALAVWLDLDVHVPPLTTPALRQAIALAINRKRLVKLVGGAAVPATQIYIPLDPQYDTALAQHPLYSYNPTRAAALVRASGYRGQPITLLYASNFPFEVNTAPALQQDLASVGIKAALRGVTITSLNAQASPLTGHQLSFSDWSIDYADAYDVYSGLMSCAANAAGTPAGAHYCDATSDTLVNQAETLPLGPARNALFQQAQRRILHAAAEVPLLFVKTVEMVSPTVGGFYYNPVFGWQFENYWLKAS